MSFTVRNHYVPQWYQRRFMNVNAGQSKLWYLDLKPDPIRRPDGSTTTRRALRHLGPINCFQQDHLYTLYFGEYETDVVEKRFFGAMDRAGEKAVAFFAQYDMRAGVREAFLGMLDYLAAQLFRTPKGLRLLRALSQSSDHQATLQVLQEYWQVFHTIWTEGVWEVINCEQQSTKFIISDSPVITYNPQVFPGSREVQTLGMAAIERIGTRTLFPIDPDHCLVITNLQFVRNPKVSALKVRENPRYFAQAMFDLRGVQRGRAVDEQEVLAVNHVLKTHATRYIAATDPAWLYPEAHLKDRTWTKIGGRYFAMPDPRKVPFSTAKLLGFEGGGSWRVNEYGHMDVHNERAKSLRSAEWKAFQSSKKAWDERDRIAGRSPPADVHEYF